MSFVVHLLQVLVQLQMNCTGVIEWPVSEGRDVERVFIRRIVARGRKCSGVNWYRSLLLWGFFVIGNAANDCYCKSRSAMILPIINSTWMVVS